MEYNLTNVLHFHDERDFDTLQESTLLCGYGSAGHMVGEQWCTWCLIFKSRCSMIVAFFLMCTVHTYIG